MTKVDFDDDSFDDFDLDEFAIAQIDAVEGQLLTETRDLAQPAAVFPLRTGSTGASRLPHTGGSSLAAIQPCLADHSRRKGNGSVHRLHPPSTERFENVRPKSEAAAGPSRLPALPTSRSWTSTASTANSSTQLVQRNLFGEVAQSVSASGCLVMSSQAGDEKGGTKRAWRTKQWEQRSLNRAATSGVRRSTTINPGDRDGGTGVGKEVTDDFELEDIDEWGSQSQNETQSWRRPPVEIALPPDSMKLQLDHTAAQKFIYPTNMIKRDYQFNIVQRALYDNVLVALPTGLGKTFIAAVVILNFFHWYPKGKIVFVAPTRPLVNQQQVACHGICGLPWDLACEMTGNTTKSRRGDEWEEKRIFYMTPQTLDNDLRTGDIDPRDIICLVVDEAHRATGNYAYCNIVAQIQAANPYYRILALTATPGSTAERVQEVIDNLHISLIELRTEEALDIRQYIHRKHEETITVAMTDDFRQVRDLYLDVMRDNCEALVKHGLLPNADPSTLHPFRVRSVYGERKDIIAKKRWLGATIQETARMAEARSHLDIFSIRMFRRRAQELVDGIKKQDGKKMKLAQVLNLAASIPDQAHPKMIAAVDTILFHFEKEQKRGNEATRVMVFCSLRECVHEIVELLNAHETLKATPFIGQSADKQGRGLTQKQQKEIIEKFKKGIVNVIVATSIGEEGLDIGEVDLIVCYEAVKDSVRMLQRVGRTGRKRDGRIVVLMSEGPESSIWQKSKDTYKGVQNTINAGHSVTLFDDVPRLIPPSIKPVPIFEELDQPDFKPELIGRKVPAAGRSVPTEKAKRRKERLANVKRSVPEGAVMGFLRASSLTSSKGKARLQEGYDDEIDNHQIANVQGISVQHLSDDSDDEALERGLEFGRRWPADELGSPPPARHLQKATSTVSKQGQRLGVRRPIRRLAVETSDDSASDGSDVVRLAVSEDDVSHSMRRQPPVLASQCEQQEGLAHSAVLGCMDGSAPPRTKEGQCKTAELASSSQDFDFSWTMNSDGLADLTQAFTSGRTVSREISPDVYQRREAHPLIARLAAQQGLRGSDVQSRAVEYQVAATKVADRPRFAPVLAEHGRGEENTESAGVEKMWPTTATQALAATQEESPLLVRYGRAAPRPIISTSSPDQAPLVSPISSARSPRQIDAAPSTSHPSLEHLKKRKASRRNRIDANASKPRKSLKKRISNSPTSRALFRFEAERDTDEERRGVRSDSDDEGANTNSADSSDLEHVGEFQPTQAPRGYNQKSIYQQSLLTQGAPTPFRRKTVGGFVGGRYGTPSTPDESSHRRALGAERAQNADSDDRYSVDSFVCDDDEIEYASEVGGEGGGSCSDD